MLPKSRCAAWEDTGSETKLPQSSFSCDSSGSSGPTRMSEEEGSVVKDDKAAPETVLFDVGGTVYKVSRSLLTQHSSCMLARMASETWNDGSHSGPLFVERDGERFRYVLDYMRDGQVLLPATVSKEAIVHELAYFGLDADPQKIRVGFAVAEAVEHLDTMDRHFRKLATDNKIRKQCVDLAHGIFEEFRRGPLHLPMYMHEPDLVASFASIRANGAIDALNDLLGLFGVYADRASDRGGLLLKKRTTTTTTVDVLDVKE